MFELVENWEKQNWLLLYKLAFNFRKRLRHLFKFKIRFLGLLLFFAYVLVANLVRLANAVLAASSAQPHRFRVSPELPALNECEHNWSLREKVGPNVFLR